MMPQKEVPIRTTINLDDELVAKALYYDLTEKSEIVREALRTLIQRSASRRPIML